MSDKEFFRNLNPLDSFEVASNTSMHCALPDDWIVILADVIGSTKAIENGRYKDVNTVGAAAIMAVINVDRKTELPFIFGGDGATLAIPKEMEQGVKNALLGTQAMASDVFSLDLRVAMIPAAQIRKQGLELKLAKYRNGRHVCYTILSGQGWSWVEDAVKDPKTNQNFLLTPNEYSRAEADFSGLECRWKPIEASKDIKFCVIIKSINQDPAGQDKNYQDIIGELETIIGPSSQHHPLAKNALILSLNPFELFHGFRALNMGNFTSAIQACWLICKSTIGRFAVKYNLKIKGINWGQYRDEMIENADYRKFDGALKMVVDVSHDQADKIVSLLEKKRSSGEIIYGVQKSKKAIMTCLVFSSKQNHAHFVDGSDGGYALAAKMLKDQAKLLGTGKD